MGYKYIGTQVTDEFYATLIETANIEERKISDFIRLSVRERILTVRQRHGMD